MVIFDKFLEELNEKILDNVESLNSGGCGIFAYLCTKKLREKGIMALIQILINPCSKEIDITKIKEDNRRIKNGDYTLYGSITANHFAVEANGYIFDGYSQVKDGWFNDHYNIGYYSLSEMDNAIKKGNDWNSSYNRELNDLLNNIICQTVDKYFP